MRCVFVLILVMAPWSFADNIRGFNAAATKQQRALEEAYDTDLSATDM
jgi:hypothetical protein